MRFITRQKLLLTAAFMVSTPVFAVDLIGVHDLAVKNDPALQAATYRRDATGENMTQAWSNLLPTISGSANMNRGSAETTFTGEFENPEDPDGDPVIADIVSDSDTDNRS